MISALRQRLARDEGGFTLIELLVVIIIIGILLAIAVPSYLNFRTRANDAAATANVRAAVPSAEAYFADNGSYTGMDIAALESRDAGLKLSEVTVAEGGATYCIASDTNGATEGGNSPHHYSGPGGEITAGACS